jgi:polyisoprenoid-binding protein YceI
MTCDVSPIFSQRAVIALAALLAMSRAASAADYVSNPDAGQVTVQGTSSLHAWTVKGAALTGKVTAAVPPTMEISAIDLSIPVNSLKSTEGSGMDNVMYDALKSKQNGDITYHLTKATLKSPPTGADPNYHFDAAGQLTVAGSARPVELDIAVQPGDGGRLTVTTQTTLKMSDFGIKPPTAMLGMIKSGDAVTVNATWQLTPAAKP